MKDAFFATECEKWQGLNINSAKEIILKRIVFEVLLVRFSNAQPGNHHICHDALQVGILKKAVMCALRPKFIFQHECCW